jgi:hypothetical protein
MITKPEGGSESDVPGRTPSRAQRCELGGAASAPRTAIKRSVESLRKMSQGRASRSGFPGAPWGAARGPIFATA